MGTVEEEEVHFPYPKTQKFVDSPPPRLKPTHSYIQKFLEQRWGGGMKWQTGCWQDLPQNAGEKRSGAWNMMWWRESSKMEKSARSAAVPWKSTDAVDPQGFQTKPPSINCGRTRQRNCCYCCWSSGPSWCTGSVTSSAHKQRQEGFTFSAAVWLCSTSLSGLNIVWFFKKPSFWGGKTWSCCVKLDNEKQNIHFM